MDDVVAVRVGGICTITSDYYIRRWNAFIVHKNFDSCG
jgi:hypothetical protein